MYFIYSLRPHYSTVRPVLLLSPFTAEDTEAQKLSGRPTVLQLVRKQAGICTRQPDCMSCSRHPSGGKAHSSGATQTGVCRKDAGSAHRRSAGSAWACAISGSRSLPRSHTGWTACCGHREHFLGQEQGRQHTDPRAPWSPLILPCRPASGGRWACQLQAFSWL